MIVRKKYYEHPFQPNRRYFDGIRNLAMLWLMHDFDLSITEATNLKWHELNLSSGKLHLKTVNMEQERIFWLDKESLIVMQEWRDCQAKGTYYRALEHVFTTMEGRPISPRYVQLLMLGLVIYTFLPLNFLPIAKADLILER